MSVINLTQSDLDHRLDRAKCCAGSMGNTVANDFKYGRKCANKNLKELQLLNNYIKVLERYQALNDEEEQSSGSFEIQSASSGSIAIAVNGESLGGVFAGPGTTATIVATELTSVINSSEHYTAERSFTNITVTGTRGALDNGNRFTFGLTGDYTLDTTKTTDFSAGRNIITEEDNAITEEEAKDTFEKISKICKLCFANEDYTYKT